ncbi:hypothetical protein ACHAXS_008649 [Conticribra weissflogii]
MENRRDHHFNNDDDDDGDHHNDLSSPLLLPSNQRPRRRSRRPFLSRSLPPQRNLPSAGPSFSSADEGDYSARSAPAARKFSSARLAESESVAAWHPRLDVANTLASHALAEGRDQLEEKHKKRHKKRQKKRQHEKEQHEKQQKNARRHLERGATSFSEQSTEYCDSDVAEGREDEGEDDDISDSANKNDAAHGHSMRTILKAALVVLASSAGAAASVAAILATPAIVVVVAGAVCLGTVPVVWVGEWRLFRLPALRSRLNGLRSEANRLREELQILVAQEMDLKDELQRCARYSALYIALHY